MRLLTMDPEEFIFFDRFPFVSIIHNIYELINHLGL